MTGGGLDATAWVASGRRMALSGGRHLFVRRAGAGPALLLLHGYPSWSWDWSRVAPALEAEATVITPDLLGFGRSDKPRGRYAIAGQADLVEELVAAEGVGAVHLVAHDYGTIVAQELLDRRRRGALGLRVEAVTLLNAAIIAGLHRRSRAHDLLSRPVVGAVAAALAPPARWREGLQRLAGPGYRIGDDEFAQLWSGNLAAGGRVQLHRMMHYIAERGVHGERWEAALAAYDGPLRFVWGMHDPLSGAHVLEQARRRYPRATVVELDGVGHWPQLEAPAAVAAAIAGRAP